MTVINVLRHAHSQANQRGILAGRTPNIGLSERGERQARELTELLKPLKIDRIISSPLERCQETIAPFLSSFGGDVRIDERLIEMDYGTWTGKKLKTLAIRPLWRTIQRNPASVQFPGGESFTQMQSRVTECVDDVIAQSRKMRVLLVTHGDICKFLTTYFLGLPFNDFQRFHVDPASLSSFTLTKNGFSVSHINLSRSTSASGGFMLGGSHS